MPICGKQKVDGRIRHTIEIIYNFVGAAAPPTSAKKEQEKRRGITPRLILKGQPYRKYPDGSAVKLLFFSFYP